MLTSVQRDLVAYLNGLRGAGNALAGIRLVQFGDAPVPTQLLPAITVDWDGRVAPRVLQGRMEVVADFAVTLYACSMESEAKADAAAQDLLIKVGSPKWTGLLPALAGIPGYTDDNGQGYTITIDPQVAGATLKRGGTYEAAAIVTLHVQTWLNKAQF